MSNKNVDDLIVASMNPDYKPKEPAIEVKQSEPERTHEAPVETPVTQEEPKTEYEPNIEAPAKEEKKEEKAETKSVDEYGNEIKPPRTYTEDEVQRMIRERLQRGQHAQQQQQAPVQQNGQPTEEWEKELNEFVDKRLINLEKERAEKQWQDQQKNIQAAFEAKFNTGMERYDDFRQVVEGKPITDPMMMATRDMENPAAFIYAASKYQGAELERISKIPDPYVQAREMGRLEERMRKKSNITKAPAPPSRITGDAFIKEKPKTTSQDEMNNRINEYGRQKKGWR